jgi:hypothetical protein
MPGLRRLALMLCLTAAPAAAGDIAPAGVYESPGYGYVFKTDGKTVSTYDISPAGCVKGPSYKAAAFHGFYGAARLDASGAGYLDRPPTRDAVRRIERLPKACAKPSKSAASAANLDHFAATFAAYYPFFAMRGVDWTSRTEAARGKISAGADLFDVLAELAAGLNDHHVSVAAGKRGFDPDPIVAPGTAPGGEPWSRRGLRVSHRDFLQGPETPLTAPAIFAGERRVLYGRTKSGFGYISILAQGGWGAGETEDTSPAAHVASVARVMDAVLGEIGDAKGLIIDLRANSGGFDAVSLEIASRFADRERVAWRKKDAASAPYDVRVAPGSGLRYQGPIAVLIGPNTVSAGESMAQSLGVLPQARLFGRPTGGSWSDAIPKTLPNGWTYTMSIESAFTPEGRLLEASGVAPHETTPAPADASGAALWGGDIAAAEAWLKDAAKKN